MASKSSWRLKFIDIDTSFSVKTEPGTIKGYMVVRAPKGETEPYFFEKGNQQAIEAYIGLGGSDYPDVGEAIAFNREYGLYISAPSGTSSEYPSYIGGKYLTSDGIIDFYNVENRDNIDYTQAGDFSLLGKNAKVSFIPRIFSSPKEFIPGKTEMYAITITGISKDAWKDLKELAVNYQGDNLNRKAAGTYYYNIDKATHKVYCENPDGTVNKSVYVGIWGETPLSEYFITLGGGSWLTDTSKGSYSDISVPTIYTDIISAIKGKSYTDQPELGSSTYTFEGEATQDTINFTMATVSLGTVNLSAKFDNISKFENGEVLITSLSDELVGAVHYTYNISPTGTSVTLSTSETVEGFPKLINLTATSSEGTGTEEGQFFDVVVDTIKNNTLLESLDLNEKVSLNTYNNKNIPFFNLQNLSYKLEEYTASDEDLVQTRLSDIAIHFLSFETSPAWEGKSFIDISQQPPVSYELKTFSFDSTSYITVLKDILHKTFGVIYQKSPSEKLTDIKITNIGYDKWSYSNDMPLLMYTSIDEEVTEENISILKKYSNVIISEKIISDDIDQVDLKIYEVNTDEVEIGKALDEVLINTTNTWSTQDILISKVFVDNKDSSANKLLAKILYIESENDIFIERNPEEELYKSSKYHLKKDNNFNTFTFSVSEEVYSKDAMTSGGTFTGSSDPTAKDTYGTNIYWPNVLNETDFSFVEVLPTTVTLEDFIGQDGIYMGPRIVEDKLSADFTGTVPPHSYEGFLKGQRYMSYLVNDNKKNGFIGSTWRKEFEAIISEGWAEAYDANYDDVYIFMEPTGNERVKPTISSLVEGTHKLAIAISTKLLSLQEAKKPSTVIVTARNKQHAQYCGEFMEYDSRTGKNYYTTPIGDIGKMCCRIMEKKMGGWAPAWYNYNSMGGQLDRAVIKARYNLDDPATEVLDKKGLNPIIFNADDGLMVVSSKTTQDPINESDWSFLEHVMSFVLLKREVRDNVMRPQIKKPIDDYWMSIRQEQVDTILDKRIAGPNKIWSQAVCNIKGVNDKNTKAQRKFCIVIKVKTVKFAETVELTLETVGETVSL